MHDVVGTAGEGTLAVRGEGDGLHLARLLSGPVTASGCGVSCKRSSPLPVRRFHSRMLPSPCGQPLAERKRRPSGDTARRRTGPVWPSNRPIISREPFQHFIVRSAPR